MNIYLKYGLPFVKVIINFRGMNLQLNNVLLDTGSAGTVFNADVVEEIGVKVEPGDILNKIRGVGGVEVVYSKYFDQIKISDILLENFEVEIGKMDYGMEIDGIIGFDFIRATNLIIDSNKLRITKSD